MGEGLEIITDVERNRYRQDKPELRGLVTSLWLGLIRQSLGYYFSDQERKEQRRVKPYQVLLAEGVEGFRSKHPEIPVYWQRNEEYLTLADFTKLLARPVSEEEAKVLSRGEARRGKWLKGKPLTMILIGGRLMGVDWLARRRVVQQRLPAKIRDVLMTAEAQWADQSELLRELPFLEITEAIEKEVEDKGGPVGMKEILPMFLERSKGDLGKSLYELVTYLKVMTRYPEYYLKKRGIERSELPFEWVARHIKDEYQPLVPYLEAKLFSTNPDENLENLAGIPYHSAYIAALLGWASPGLVRSLVMVEYMTEGKEHGSRKAFADALLLNNLGDVASYLESLSAS